jgi:16S rRNA (cytosine1402-N4)-methyltransferase
MHIPVLLDEIVNGLEIKDGEVVFDGTLGEGGHSKRFLESAKNVSLVGTDADKKALEKTEENLKNVPGKKFLYELNFRNVDQALKNAGFEKIDKALLDLGFSSNQIDGDDRGFSFMKDSPLVMTYEQNPGKETTTAYDVVNNWSEENLKTIIEAYGEEKNAWKISKAIVEKRQEGEIKTSGQLRELIEKVSRRKGKINPATKTFQAIRIAVNDEIRALEEALNKIFFLLSPKGKMAIISFHSIEDRVVKRFFKERPHDFRR